jgi:predicted nuclease of predicted toxin-antitoxin system
MRLLADQDVYQVTIDRLKQWGHDVVTVKELGLQGSPDEDVLRIARIENRLLITRDKGFGTLIFLNKTWSTGVITLKITPVTIEEVHQEVHRLFEEHTEEELNHLFCVVEPRRHRIRQV